MIALLFALQALPPPDSPQIVRLKQHLAVLEKVDFEKVSGSVLGCIRGKADSVHPERNELGRQRAAAKAAKDWMVDCHLDRTRAQLIASLRRKDKSLVETEAGAIADSGLSMTTLVILMLANKTYKIEPAITLSVPLEIERPQEDHAPD